MFQSANRMSLRHFTTPTFSWNEGEIELRGQGSNTSVSYAGVLGFKSRSSDPLPWMRLLVFFLIISK